MRESPDQRQPEFRHLRIYAIDPMVSRAPEHQATVQIRFEQLELRPGMIRRLDGGILQLAPQKKKIP